MSRVIEKVQDLKERIKNFEEVSLGYTEEEALNEANRCLQCINPKCSHGCPANVSVKEFICELRQKNYDKAINIIRQNSNFSGVCGRICPQEKLCEGACILNVKKDPIAIGLLERFVAEKSKLEIPKIKKTGKKVAIVGAGPSGLSCAYFLAIEGVDVTICEAYKRGGGVLTYGVPEFRLPRKIIAKEIEYLSKLGVKIKTNAKVDKKLFKEIKKNYDAVLIATGAVEPLTLSVPGENLNGVISSKEFFINASEDKEAMKGEKKTLVIGGGDVAMDCARTAKRLGRDVTIVYRRTDAEMPARQVEKTHAEEEGVKFLFLTAPFKIIGEKNVEAIECVKMMLTEPDSTGRRKPVKIENSNFRINCNEIIVATGQNPDISLAKEAGLDFTKDKTVAADEKNKTNEQKIFASGDVVIGSSLVVKAVADGRKAAKSILEYLKEKN